MSKDDSNEQVEESTDVEKEESENSEEKLLEQNAALKDSLLRKIAEIENLRKRLEKEKEDAVKYANKSFACDLLSVLDNFERISENSDKVKSEVSGNPSLKACFDGILICEKDILSTFKKYGISKIEAHRGDKFNHEFHQAMCEEKDDEVDAGAIVQVLQNGYTYNERLLRPAMVKVAKK